MSIRNGFGRDSDPARDVDDGRPPAQSMEAFAMQRTGLGGLRRLGVGCLASAIAIVTASNAAGFGTITRLGQNAEHERMTRLAFAQSGMGPATLDVLAGRAGTFGAVGAPDNPKRNLLFLSDAHCDNADHLDVEGYPQRPKQAADILTRCRTWMSTSLEQAVTSAGRLVSAGLVVDAGQAALAPACRLTAAPDRAKCEVLANLGLTLHAAQDFYSHSNWVDQTTGPTGALNPPGLGNVGRAPWLDLRTTPAFPAGLITGCFQSKPETLYCKYPRQRGGLLQLFGQRDRVRHLVLNKDEGPIDVMTGAIGAGTTQRSQGNQNFQRAVGAAIEDTRDKWSFFRERVIATYGQARGEKILCVVLNDQPGTCG